MCDQPAGGGEPSTLRPWPPPAVHFKISVLTVALGLWDLLPGAGLRLPSLDVGTGFLRGQGESWSRFSFQSGLLVGGVGGGGGGKGGGLLSPRPLCCGWCFLIGFADGGRACVAPGDPPRGSSSAA